MQRHRIRHTTGFSYEGEVTASYNEARMLPAGDEGQIVLQSQLEISPMSSTHGYTDYWGTRVNSFEILQPHGELTITATSLVEVRPVLHDWQPLDWSALAERSGTALDFVEHLAQTRLTAPADDVIELAERIRDEQDGPCAAALAVSRTIGEQVEYVRGATSVHSTAAEAWEERKGVCQDIAHIALGALRAIGIPARYVSGYLHPKPGAVVGETVRGESHAWVEWFCGGWRGYDPTNRIDIGDRHVVVGRGRDYTDVAPLRGVYAGPFRSKLFVTVEITREA